EVPSIVRAIRRAAGISEVIHQSGSRVRVARGKGRVGLRVGTKGVCGSDGDDWRIDVEVNGGGVKDGRAFASRGLGPDAIADFALTARLVAGVGGQIDA